MTLVETNNNRPISYPLFGSRYGQIFPSSRKLREHFRSAQLGELDGTEVAKLRDPYTRSDKLRFEDAFTRDPIARRSICSYVNFLLGSRTETSIDLAREFMNPDTEQQALGVILNQSEINELKTLIDRTNARVKFHARIEAACVQAFVGGRSALLVEREQGGMPTDLKVLTWSKLGQVFADKDTWEFLGVEYQDREDPLRAEELIYFSNLDYNVSPDSLYYGRSMLEPVIDAVETNQYIFQEDIKETTRKLWASSGLVKFPPNIDPEQAREFLRGFLPGTWNSTSLQVELEQYGIDVKLKELIDVSNALDTRVRTGIGTPGLLVGDENVLNYATANMVMHAWKESELNRYRTWLQDVLEPQWYNSLIQLRFPDLDLTKLLIKVKMEFRDVTFDTLRDRAESLLPAVQSGYLSPEKFLEVLDFEDEIEKRAAAQQEADRKRQQDLEAMREERKRNQQKTEKVPPQLQEELKRREQDQQQRERDQNARASLVQEVKTEISDLLESNKKSLQAIEQMRQGRLEQERTQRIFEAKPEQEIETFNTSQLKLEYEREIHQKQMQILEQKEEAIRELKAKIASLS